ncbi:MAG: OmpA family protein [Bacteroidales bacterium]|nr:OmpA family protein [Candidatus Liminaster caballi]
MKKLFSIAVIAALCASSFAQSSADEEPIFNVRTNSFWDNWFVQLNYSFNINASSEENASMATYDPSFGDRLSHGVALSIGKWHTTGYGWRVKMNGFYMPMLGTTSKGDNQAFFSLETDGLFNLTNLIWGYKEHRRYNGSVYLGPLMGVNATSETLSYGYSFGYINNWRLNDRWSLNAEIALRQFVKNANGMSVSDNSSHWRNQDHQYAIELGVTYNLGKNKKHNWKKAVDEDALRADYDKEIAALNDQVAKEQADNARLEDELKKKPNEVVVKEIQKVGVSVPQSLFFSINSAKLVSDRELVNLSAIVESAKQNPESKVYVTGYADSKTGTPSYNQSLSERRAETVAKELEKLGLSRDQMVISGKGGDATISKAAHNRRVVVEVK